MVKTPVFDISLGRSIMLDPSAFVADPELVDALSKQATPIVCDTDRVLFRQGDSADGLYILHDGQATVSMTGNSGETVLSFQTSAGSLLGLPGLVSSQPYTLNAIARAGAKISFIDRAAFTAFMNSNPLLAFKVLQVLAAEVSAARRAITTP
jgi:CRP-like cAMP-binding protein